MGRVSTFADPEIIRMCKEEFVPLTGDDWYQRRRQDAIGVFFRKVADQVPGAQGGASNRQGVYIFTADGKLLGARNQNDADTMRDVLKQALKVFNNQPLGAVGPGRIKVEELGKLDTEYVRTPPKNGLIVNVYTRILDKDKKGEYCLGSCDFWGGDRAAHDHLWLQEDEWKALVPSSPKKGENVPLPPHVAKRILRFHLVDNTRGEALSWSSKEVRKQNLKLTVTEVTAKAVALQLEGSALMATGEDPETATRGYDANLLINLEYNLEKKSIVRFDGVAMGSHWGIGPYTPGARPGRTPLGIAFELSSGDRPADHVPPAGTRYLPGYLRADGE